MATFIGNAGEHQSEKALNRRLNLILTAFVGFTIFIVALSWTSGYMMGHRSLLSCFLAIAACLSGIPAYKYMNRSFDKQMRLSRKDAEGAEGEKEIIPYLKNLPDTFTVISDFDFADSYGNIDHLVIGPTGLFSIDVKKWRGAVTSDGKGELLQNGQPTRKPEVRYFLRRTMELKDRLKALTKLDPYVQCLFVFPHTHLQAKWGTTGFVHCIHAHQLESYITQYRSSKPPPPETLPRLVKAAADLQRNAPSQQPLAQASAAKAPTAIQPDLPRQPPPVPPRPQPPADITFSCSGCGQHLVIDASAAGLSVACPTCNLGLIVPDQARM